MAGLVVRDVHTKNPDSALLRKMVALAARLDAHVQGDEGERYDGSGPLDSSRGR